MWRLTRQPSKSVELDHMAGEASTFDGHSVVCSETRSTRSSSIELFEGGFLNRLPELPCLLVQRASQCLGDQSCQACCCDYTLPRVLLGLLDCTFYLSTANVCGSSLGKLGWTASLRKPLISTHLVRLRFCRAKGLLSTFGGKLCGSVC